MYHSTPHPHACEGEGGTLLHTDQYGAHAAIDPPSEDPLEEDIRYLCPPADAYGRQQPQVRHRSSSLSAVVHMLKGTTHKNFKKRTSPVLARARGSVLTERISGEEDHRRRSFEGYVSPPPPPPPSVRRVTSPGPTGQIGHTFDYAAKRRGIREMTRMKDQMEDLALAGYSTSKVHGHAHVGLLKNKKHAQQRAARRSLEEVDAEIKQTTSLLQHLKTVKLGLVTKELEQQLADLDDLSDHTPHHHHTGHRGYDLSVSATDIHPCSTATIGCGDAWANEAIPLPDVDPTLTNTLCDFGIYSDTPATCMTAQPTQQRPVPRRRSSSVCADHSPSRTPPADRCSPLSYRAQPALPHAPYVNHAIQPQSPRCGYAISSSPHTPPPLPQRSASLGPTSDHDFVPAVGYYTKARQPSIPRRSSSLTNHAHAHAHMAGVGPEPALTRKGSSLTSSLNTRHSSGNARRVSSEAALACPGVHEPQGASFEHAAPVPPIVQPFDQVSPAQLAARRAGRVSAGMSANFHTDLAREMALLVDS